jgi:hypothetical protein
MRKLYELDCYRVNHPNIIALYGNVGNDTCGAFEVQSPVDGGTLRIIASALGGFDHVSVSRQHRCPDWAEMEHVKRLFFENHEIAMQLHVAIDRRVSCHPNCLHLWRPNDGREIPLPPEWMIA